MAVKTRPSTANLGWELGDYSILRTVDSGKFGIVYWAQHKPTGQQVALKLIPLEGGESEEKVSAERHGAMLQQKFSRAHKGMVPEIFEHQPIAMFYAIAMELVHGQPLSDVIAGGALPSERAAKIALSICRFLAAAHQFETEIEGVHYRLIVHGDLKPDHVLLLDNDEIRVLDFGIAKALAERTLVTTNKWGSIQYASPERLQSEGHVNEQADFWSLGIILFEMVAGFRPYRRYEHDASRLDAAIRRHELPEPLPPSADPVLVAIIRKMLAPQVERRYTSAALIVRDLESYLAGMPTVAATDAARASVATVRIGADGAPPPIPPIPPIPQIPPIPVIPPLPGPAPSVSIPTEPLPRGAKATATAAAAVMPPPKTKAPKKRSFFGKFVRFAMFMTLLSMTASECAGFGRAERMRDQIGSLELSDVSAARSQYRRIADMGPFGMGASQLEQPLRDRMIELADRVIHEFRTESPAITEEEWQQARASLAFAQELGPRRSSIAARRMYVDGQLTRIAAGDDRTQLDKAIGEFRESARLDSRSPDPYLGLARIYAYSFNDVDALEGAIEEAEQRGYTRGRRERAQLGDAYRMRADRERAAAARLSGDERTEMLRQAAEDYGHCIANFEGLNFFDSDDNLRRCRRRLVAVGEELRGPEQEESGVPFLPALIDFITRLER
jgi:serine/threonine protein kinase